jgi:hypothetical protein
MRIRGIILLFITFLFISACSSDDSVSSNMESAMTLDNAVLPFDRAWKITQSTDNGTLLKLTLYHSEETCPKCGTAPVYQQLDLIFMPSSEENITGTYNVSLSTEPGLINGNFYNNGFPINFREGSVSITNAAGGMYKIELNDVRGTFWQDPSRIYSFDGYFTGKFPEKEE